VIVMVAAFASILFSTNSAIAFNGLLLREGDDADRVPIVADFELAAVGGLGSFEDLRLGPV